MRAQVPAGAGAHRAERRLQGQDHHAAGGKLCLPNQDLWNGKCVPKCPPGQVHTGPNGVCKVKIIIPPVKLCLPNQDNWKGKCVPKCAPGQMHFGPSGLCIPKPIIPAPIINPIPIPKP